LIEATLTAIDQVGMGDASIALIARLAGVSNGIISHYFQDKNGLIAATMRYLMNVLIENVHERRLALKDDSPRAHLQVIIEGNFDASQVNGPAMKTWLAFWATSMHHPSLWLRGALSGDAFDTAQAQRIAYEYMDFQLAKQVS
jgi:TetR/AcrR family transcriptional repressor of bet genes